uniref:Uncharacterized protein n=1 Tax=Glossina brevipalpis TaxID=37001 RepID=A0A1A9W463_9MUSC
MVRFKNEFETNITIKFVSFVPHENFAERISFQGESMIYSRESLSKKQKKPFKRNDKLKTPLQSLSLKKSRLSNSTHMRNNQQGYVVEEIEYQNTWEAFDNINECSVLECFIDRYTCLYRHIIGYIITEMKQKITEENLELDPAALNVCQLDKYEEHTMTMKVDLILLAQFKASRSRNN